MITGERMRKLARYVVKNLPKGFGFCIIVFPFNKPGISNYISNAERATMIEALKEKIKVLENNEDFRTPEVEDN